MRFGSPPPAPLIAGQITQESHWDPNLTSPVGAQGLMQFMAKAARDTEVIGQLGQVHPFDPVWAIRAGVWYDHWQYRQVTVFDTDCDRWHFTLSGYNGGMRHVKDRQQMSERPGSWSMTGKIQAPNVSPINQKENEQYSPKIIYKHQRLFIGWGRTVCL